MVTLDTAWVNASGDFGAGTLPIGGHIVVSAWGRQQLELEERRRRRPTFASGDIELNAGGTITTRVPTSTVAAPTLTHTATPAKPDIPVITVIDAGPVFKQDLWVLCGASSISGMKFNDLNGNHVRDRSPRPSPGSQAGRSRSGTRPRPCRGHSHDDVSGGTRLRSQPAATWSARRSSPVGHSAPVAGVACTNGALGYPVDSTSAGTAPDNRSPARTSATSSSPPRAG